jgi:predicted RNA-binding Zn ribbon-like protein
VLRRQDLDPAERRRYQTGRPCLDLTHTGGYGEHARWEILHSADDLARALGIVLDAEPPVTTAADLGPAKELRHAVMLLARTRAAGEPQPAEAVATVNRCAADPPLVPRLGDDLSTAWEPGTAAQALSTLARDAIVLFGSPLADRIRICASETCGLLFVDASRPGRRRWCSMEWCGDIQKKRRARGASGGA